MSHPLQTAADLRADLRAARAVIADTPHHADDEVARACRLVIRASRCATERARAGDLLALIEGEAA